MGEFELGVPDRPLKEYLAQPRASRDRHPFGRGLQAGTVFLDYPPGTNATAVLDQPEADGIGSLIPIPRQFERFDHAAVGAAAAHAHFLAEKSGFEVKILFF